MAKIIKLEEVPEKVLNIGQVRWIDENTGLTKFGLAFAEIKPGTSFRYHFHEKREHIHIILEGKAKFSVEGEEHIIGSNTIILIPAGEKHRWESIGDSTLKFIEVFSPLDPDEINVSEN